MAQDDLVPDEALVSRLEALANALQGVAEVASMREHLPADMLLALSEQAFKLVGECNAAAQPDDEINAKYRSRMRDEFVITLSGHRFYLYDPKPEEVAHRDIVAGLTNECRYAGQVPRFYSVAEHGIKVAAVTEHVAMEAVSAGELPEETVALACLYALLHDAHEAYSGDVPMPFKARLADVFGTPWERIEDAVQDAIHAAYGIPPLPVEVESIIHQADKWMLYAEVIALKGSYLDQFPSLQRMPPPPPEVLNVGRVKPGEPSRDAVRDLFDGEVRRLVSLVGGRIPGDEMDERRIDRRDVAEKFAQAVAASGIPGDRENPPAPPVNQVIENPTLSRVPRTTDVSHSTWQQAVRSSSVETPSPSAMQRLLNDPELTADERARLSEMGGK